MPDVILHDGTWTRQVLKGRRRVRVAFIPDDTAATLQSTNIKIDEDDKMAWENLLGGDPGIDINLGLIMVRFNPDGKSGIATFLSNLPSQPEIVSAFQQSEPDPGGPDAGPGDFIGCLNGKKTILGINFNFPRAFSECLSQLFV